MYLLDVLRTMREEMSSGSHEMDPSIETVIEDLDECIAKMVVIEDELAEVYPERILAMLKGWLVKIHSGELPF